MLVSHGRLPAFEWPAGCEKGGGAGEGYIRYTSARRIQKNNFTRSANIARLLAKFPVPSMNTFSPSNGIPDAASAFVTIVVMKHDVAEVDAITVHREVLLRRSLDDAILICVSAGQ